MQLLFVLACSLVLPTISIVDHSTSHIQTINIPAAGADVVAPKADPKSITRKQARSSGKVVYAAHSDGVVESVQMPDVGNPRVGGGQPWTEEEALIIMAKLMRIITMTEQAKPKGFFDDYECRAGPNFSMPCDGKNNEFCHVDNCKADGKAPAKAGSHPALLRLGFHDCFRHEDGSGGCDGCFHFKDQFGKYVQLHGGANKKDGKTFKRMYDESEDDSGGNNGLAAWADLLELVYVDRKFPTSVPELPKSMKESGKSRADLWAFAALVTAKYSMEQSNEACGKESTRCEHIYNHITINHACKITLSKNFRFFTGRRDCPVEEKATDPSTSSRIPHRYRDYESTVKERQPSAYSNGTMLVDYFRRDFGFSRQETVAIMGAHALGGFNFQNTMFKYKWQFGNEHFLNNNYYRNIAAMPSKKQLCGRRDLGKKQPPTFGGAPGGGDASTGWWLRPLRETPSGGPYLWFHYYRRCPNCYKKKGKWKSAEMRGGKDFMKKKCCVCNEQAEKDVDPKCFINVTHDETAVSADLGLYYRFNVGPHGIPLDCPGMKDEQWTAERLADATLDKKTRPQGGINYWDMEPRCPKNMEKDEGETMSTSDYVELYAMDQNRWANDFVRALEKMLSNGYDDGELTEGPDVLGLGEVNCQRVKRDFVCARKA